MDIKGIYMIIAKKKKINESVVSKKKRMDIPKTLSSYTSKTYYITNIMCLYN